MSRFWRWDGASLRFDRTEFNASYDVVRGSTEVWRLDDRRRLVITFETREGNKTQSRKVAFRQVK